jgi:hypothetical protein
MPDNGQQAGSGLDTSITSVPQQNGGFLGQVGSGLQSIFGGPNYGTSDPNASPLDRASSILQDRIKRADEIARNPLAQFFWPEQTGAARNFVPQATEQLQTIEKQKADITAGRQQAQVLGLDPGEVSDQATREDRVTAAQARALRGDLKAFQGLQAIDPKAAESIQDQVHSVVSANLETAQTAFNKLSSARGQGEYEKILRGMRKDGDIAGLEKLGLKIPERFDVFGAAKGREAEALRNARIGVDTIRQKLEARNTYQPMEEKEAKTYNGRLSTAYGDAYGNGVWSRNAAAGTRGFVINGAGDPRDLGRTYTLATPEQRKSIKEEFDGAVPKEDMEKFRVFNRTRNLAITDPQGNFIPAEGAKNSKGELRYINTNPNVQQGVAEGLASMLRGGTGGANSQLMKIELAKRGWAQGTIDDFLSNYAGAMNTMFRDANVEGKPYQSQRTQKQIRDVIDALQVANDNLIADRTTQIARRAGALGLDSSTFGFGKNESTGAIGSALEEGRQAQIDRMTPFHQAIGGGDGVFQIGAQRPGAGATDALAGTSPTTQLAGAPQLKTPVQQAIAPIASRYGIDPNDLVRTVQIESGGNPRAQTGSYKGLTQLSDSDFGKYKTRPDASIWNAQDNLEAGAAKMKAEGDQFAKNFDRRPSGFDTYMIHQQGLAGYSQHLANPNAPAWQNMASTGEGRQKGDVWAKKAIWGNIPDQYKASFGNVNNVTSRDFLAMWQQRWNRAGGSDAAATPVNSGSQLAAQNDPSFRLRGYPRASANSPLNATIDQFNAGLGQAAVEHAPAIGSTVGAIGGGAVGGLPGMIGGGGVGGVAGQSFKDWMQGNSQSPTKLAEQGALGAVLGVMPAARPVAGLAARTLGAGAVEGGAEAAKGGDAEDVAKAAGVGTASALAGEGFGRALGMVGHKIWQYFSPDARATVREAAKKYAEAKETLLTEPSKLAGVAGPNPKYAAAEKARDDAESVLKDAGLNPEHAAYAHTVDVEPGMTKAEAEIARPGVLEKQRVSAAYDALREELPPRKGLKAAMDATESVRAGTSRLSDGPVAAVESGRVSKKHAELAERAENAIVAPVKNWDEKWRDLVDTRSSLLAAERDALESTAIGKTQVAKDMRTLADTVRVQQEKVATAVFGKKAGEAFIGRLEVLDKRYATLMEATNGGKVVEAAKWTGDKGKAADKAFRAFAHDDPTAIAAWDAMRHPERNVEKDIRTLVGVEGIPILGHVVKYAKLAANWSEWQAQRAAGGHAKFIDFVPELKEALAARSRMIGNAAGTAGARAGISAGASWSQ